MTTSKLIIFSVCLLFCGASEVNAQNGTVTSGGVATGVDGNVSYSIGQVNYMTLNSASGTITEGLQQPYEITVISGLEEKNINLTASVYPNPTAGSVTLNSGDTDVKNMSYELLDMKGKLISQDSLSKKQTSVSMTGLAAGIYMLKVLSNKTEIKTFKIIKNS